MDFFFSYYGTQIQTSATRSCSKREGTQTPYRETPTVFWLTGNLPPTHVRLALGSHFVTICFPSVSGAPDTPGPSLSSWLCSSGYLRAPVAPEADVGCRSMPAKPPGSTNLSLKPFGKGMNGTDPANQLGRTASQRTENKDDEGSVSPQDSMASGHS